MKAPLTILALTVSLISGVTVLAQQPAATPEESTTPARLLTGDMEVHLQELQTKLSINSSRKEVGPFGLYQDLDKEAPKRLLPKRPSKSKEVVIPFAAVIDELPVTMVIPSERSFMVNGRSFKVGDELILAVGTKTIKARVDSVTASKIEFRDIATNDQADKHLNRRKGITPGGGAITPEGVTDNRRSAQAPITLDVRYSPNAPSQ